MNQIESEINVMDKLQGKKLILYGSGEVGTCVGIEAFFEGIPVECFCDRDERKCGKDILGIPIKTISDVKCCYPKGTFYILVTMRKETAELVKRELVAQDIFDADDFYSEDTDPLEIMPILVASHYSYQMREIPQSIGEKFRSLSAENEKILRESLLTNYFHVDSYDFFTSERQKNDFSAHLYDRLSVDRELVIPWLSSIGPLSGAQVLEVGCGTGTSTVALAEQGANVTAIDVSDDSIEVARDRLQSYDLTGEILRMNAADILNELPNRKFDFIIFFASLEHMTFNERIQSIRSAYKMLNHGGHLVVAEIPNRLWYIDTHTSLEPFFHWLPDDLAMEYAKFTLRVDFNKGFDLSQEEDVLRFARWGRGVSYHEFVVALGSLENIHVESSLRLYNNGPARFFSRVLMAYGPKGVHEGFYDNRLYISIKKLDE